MPIVLNRYTVLGRTVVEAQLLTNVASTVTGEWFEVSGIHPISFQIIGINSATVQLRGSNNPSKPLDAADEFALGHDITTDGLLALDAPVKWVKAKVSAYTSGSINCYMLASSSG